MREIDCPTITAAVKQLCLDANFDLRQDTLNAYKQALKSEESELGRDVIERLIENAAVAHCHKVPFCQDTGYAVVFADVGQALHISGGSLASAIHEGVRQGYTEGALRKSIVYNPIDRRNTQDNTPATINYTIVDGEQLHLHLLVKGCGCDNVSRLKMFTPAQGLEAAKQFIVETVELAGPNASPPVVMGIGLGGPFAQAALLAQRALLWPLDHPNPDPALQALEEELIERVNALGIGPAGFGGRTTTLGLHIEACSAHIASFPVAVNIDCHSHRSKGTTL